MNPKGILYIVATPIGHMEDITLRALRVLREADIAAAEDTRLAARLFSHHEIATSRDSLHEHNEAERAESLIRRLSEGASVAVISDAGTPTISDPGYRLVHLAAESGISVVPVPGPSAAMTALSASGLPTDAFTFIGFPPKKKGKRNTLFEELKSSPRTLIFYESPRRLLDLLSELIRAWGDRDGVLCREMTKPYEEFLRGRLSFIRSEMKSRPAVRGECTLLVGGAASGREMTDAEIRSEIEKRLDAEDNRISDLSRTLARTWGLPRRRIYEQALIIRKQKETP